MKRYLSKTTCTVLCVAMAYGAGMLGAKTSQASDPFLGTIQYFGFNYAPRGWALVEDGLSQRGCDASSLSAQASGRIVSRGATSTP